MHLKSLEIHGFKSFADKTVFEFHRGVTGIVGPNGCGKSNVVDAIRWVLGETSAKALRGGEMADVIFNGTDKRKPVGMAEVTLTLSDCEGSLNTDFNEVSLCRRVFRDGRSEYRINGTLCRLRDFQELLAGTGIGRSAYSVMEQGKIDMLISAKPEDRRMVFEEAAGITKFKGQKKEALRKLEYTEANLIRLADIVAEVKRQMGTLHRQALKAKRYQSLHKDLRVLDLHLGHRQYTTFLTEKTETENHIVSVMTELHELHQSIRAKEAETAETREAYHQVESAINALRQQSQEHHSRIQAAESKIEFNRERVEELQGRIRRNEEDAANSRDLLDRQQHEMASADEQFAAIRGAIESRQFAVEEHQVFHNAIIPERQRLEAERRNLREGYRRLESESATAEAKAQNLQQQKLSDTQRHESLQQEKTSAAEARLTCQQEVDHLQRLTEDLEEERANLEQKLKDMAAEIAEKRRQRETVSEELHLIQRQHAQQRSRMEALGQIIARGEGMEQGSQNVLQGLDDPERIKAGLHGVLASSLEVEPAYLTPIEAVLRDHLQTILVADAGLAGEILTKLQEGRLGRTTLAPQTFFSGADQSPTTRGPLPAGALAWAVDQVRASSSVTPLVQRLLHQVVIVPDLTTALLLKEEQPQLILVTLSGESITREGLVHGGATKEEASSALRREVELRELKVSVQELEERIIEKEILLEELGMALEAAARAEATARDHVQLNREGLSQLHGRSSVIQRSLQQATAKLDSLEWEQNQLAARLASVESEIQHHLDTAQWAGRQLEECQERETEIEAKIEAVIRREAESTEKLNELKTALALEASSLQNIERQKAPLANRLAELEGSIQRFENECFIWKQRIDAALQENERLSLELEEARLTSSEAEQQGLEAVERRNSLFGAISTVESELNRMRQRQSEIGDHRSRSEVQMTRVEMKLENLIQQVQERYQISYDTFVPDTQALRLSYHEQRGHFDRYSKRKGGNEIKKTLSYDQDSDREAVSESFARQAAPSTLSGDEAALAAALAGMSEEGEGADTGDTLEASLATDAVPTLTEATEEVAPLDLEEPLDWDLIQDIVNDLRQKLEGIGPVNLDAIQEFEELEQRHNFLDTQHGDLVKSKDELLQVIAKINETTKMMFTETFLSVRNNFRGNFKELFGAGAQADLVLQDEHDPLECGIEIIAKPPGKKLQSISLLSGGERSMTAVALLFSIYMVKPSPFCVLDELDAPLDESNIKRFLLMLDKFLTASQFIIVTHNKRTMSVADVIYGVTMQEFGVSKPVGVRMTGEKASLEEGPTTVADVVRGPNGSATDPATEDAKAKPTRSRKKPAAVEEALI